jgi:hypothetical protein
MISQPGVLFEKRHLGREMHEVAFKLLRKTASLTLTCPFYRHGHSPTTTRQLRSPVLSQQLFEQIVSSMMYYLFAATALQASDMCQGV